MASSEISLANSLYGLHKVCIGLFLALAGIGVVKGLALFSNQGSSGLLMPLLLIGAAFSVLRLRASANDLAIGLSEGTVQEIEHLRTNLLAKFIEVCLILLTASAI